MKIKKILYKYYEHIETHKFDHLGEMDLFHERESAKTHKKK